MPDINTSSTANATNLQDKAKKSETISKVVILPRPKKTQSSPDFYAATDRYRLRNPLYPNPHDLEAPVKLQARFD